MIVLRANCGLEILEGLTLPVRRCHLCGGQHGAEDFEKVERVGQQPQISKALPTRANRKSQSLSRDKWPFWVWSLKWMRSKSDKGVGDTAQRLATKMGGEQFKRFTNKIGLPCGCTERQAEWNRLYAYSD